MTVHRLALRLLVLASMFCAVVTPRAAAQEASPVASPEAAADCTVDLGVVRSTKACVAIVHASPDAPAVDVYLNGELAVTALAPNTATPYVELPAGDYLARVVPTGGTIDQAVITVDPLTIEAAKAYEVVALGKVSGISAAVYDVTTYAVPASDAGLPQSRVRVVHAAADGKAIDASLVASDARTPWIDDLDYATAGAYVEVPAGTYRLIISAFWGESLLEVPDFTLEPDTVTSVYVVWSSASASGLELVVVTTAASRLPAPDASPVVTPSP